MFEGVHEIFIRWPSPKHRTLAFTAPAFAKRSKSCANYVVRQSEKATSALDYIRAEKKDFTGLDTSTFNRLVLRYDAAVLPEKRQQVWILRDAKGGNRLLE